METIQLSVNEQKELVFQGLGTAGYMWKCILNDASILKVERRMETTQSVNIAIGGSRNEIFTLTGLKAGTVHALFMQCRHWEAESEAINKTEYNIVVR